MPLLEGAGLQTILMQYTATSNHDQFARKSVV